MTVFLVLGGLGLLVLVVSLVAGDVLDVLEVGPDWLTPAAVGAALAAFGFAGAVALSLTDGVLAAGITYGAVGGVAAGALAGRLSQVLDRDEPERGTTSYGLLGAAGAVVDDIPAEGYGTVSATVGGHLRRVNARAGHALARGTGVRVVDVLSPTSVLVEPLEPLEPPAPRALTDR